MHQIFYQFDFELPNQEEADKLIALLAEQGFDGFVEEENTLVAFIPELKFDQDAFEKTLEMFSILSYSRSEVENINWNQKWEAEFEPVKVDDFVAIRAHFHAPVAGVQYEIVITPKMSFGTGHHATTYLVMKEMEKIDFVGKSVFDFGTGTGILAILAEKCGAAEVLAIDNDEWSITNSQENIDQNHCRNIRLLLTEEVPQGKSFDIILANINLNVLTAHAAALAAVSKPGTTILFSGILFSDEPVMQTIMQKIGFQHLNTSRRGDWICIHAQKQ